MCGRWKRKIFLIAIDGHKTKESIDLAKEKWDSYKSVLIRFFEVSFYVKSLRPKGHVYAYIFVYMTAKLSIRLYPKTLTLSFIIECNFIWACFIYKSLDFNLLLIHLISCNFWPRKIEKRKTSSKFHIADMWRTGPKICWY